MLIFLIFLGIFLIFLVLTFISHGEFMKIKKFNFSVLWKSLVLLFVAVLLTNANVGGISPFLIAFYFAGLFVGIDEKILSIICFGSFALIGWSLSSIWVGLTFVLVGLVTFYLHKICKKKIRFIIIVVAYLISLATLIYYNYQDWEYLLEYIFLGLISLFVFVKVLQVLLLRKNCFKMTLDESVCFLFFVATLGMGLAGVKIWNFEIYRLVLMLAIFVCIAIQSPKLTYSLTLSFSLGVALSSFSLLPIAEFMIVALLTSMFTLPHKLKMTCLALIADVFVQMFFFTRSTDIIWAIVPLAVAGLIFLCLGNKYLNQLGDIVYVKSSELTSRSLINTTRKNIRKRMSELSNVFQDMKRIHLDMIKRDLTKDELVAMFGREIMCACCKDCLEKNRCTRSLGSQNLSYIDQLIETAIKKGKVSLLDIPSGMSTKCGKMNQLITLLNRLTDEYKQYKNMVGDVNNVKYLLAEQMGAVSNLLLNLGKEIDTNVTFDIAKENKIINRLLSFNVQCKEVLLYAEKNDELSAVLVVRSENSLNPIIEKVVSEVLKTQMEVTKVVPFEDGEFNTIMMHKTGRYDCVFGIAGCNKSGNEVSGDCHSIIRLSGERFLLALCDGMGAGRKAHEMSAKTLGLIENFYKAGFDNDIILESVNKLLAINNQENYSTLDVCLLDLNQEIADFIKVGSPFGLIKRDSNLEVVEGGTLPIGALESITPATYKTTITTKDMVIMATDGVTDAFKTQENLKDFVAKLVSTNPQTIAENILSQALSLNEMSAKDDMTVLVARTYLKK